MPAAMPAVWYDVTRILSRSVRVYDLLRRVSDNHRPGNSDDHFYLRLPVADIYKLGITHKTHNYITPERRVQRILYVKFNCI